MCMYIHAYLHKSVPCLQATHGKFEEEMKTNVSFSEYNFRKENLWKHTLTNTCAYLCVCEHVRPYLQRSKKHDHSPIYYNSTNYSKCIILISKVVLSLIYQ